MKIIELSLDDNLINSGMAMGAISLVESPAVEVFFMAFSKEGKKEKYYFSTPKIGDKQLVYSAALIPDKLILRKDEQTGEFYSVYFSKETVAKCSEAYLKNNFNNFTADHNESIDNVNVIESWIVTDPSNDKANSLGFKDLVPGTWFVGAHIQNELIWDRIKAGELRGWSIESFFTEAFAKMSLEKELNEDDFINQRLDEIEAIEDREDAIGKLME